MKKLSRWREKVSSVSDSFTSRDLAITRMIVVVKMKKLSRWREKVSSVSDSFTSRDLAITRMIVDVEEAVSWLEMLGCFLRVLEKFSGADTPAKRNDSPLR
ncbi:hypothetical protein ACOMHN_027367 [Nucella lapillus]